MEYTLIYEIQYNPCFRKYQIFNQISNNLNTFTEMHCFPWDPSILTGKMLYNQKS